MSALTTRDALAQAIRVVDGNHDLGAAALADALIDSGAVIDAATLADDERIWEHVCATLAPIADRNSPGWDAGEMTTAALRALAAALAERSAR